MKSRAIVFTIIGALCLIFGGAGVARNDSAAVVCGTDTLQPGQVCDVTRNGKSTTMTYDELRSRDNTTNWILVGIGVVGLVVGPLMLWRETRKKAADASAPPLPTA